MKNHWWKILGVIFLLHAFLFGLLTPLSPGLPGVFPINGKAGQTLKLQIKGYNTHFDQAKKNSAWLKKGDFALLANQVTGEASGLLNATFELPEHLPSTDSIVPFSLITDNEIDGAAVLPSAVFIKQFSINQEKGNTAWNINTIEKLHSRSGIQFPYRNVLGETIRNLYFHVSLWFAMFALLAISVYHSIQYLRKTDPLQDLKANALISVGVLYGLLGCVTGSIWAKYTWGTWWTTDVKLNMAAIFMLIYLAYFVLRGSFRDEIKQARLASVYSIFAFASIIPLLFVIPRLVDSLHPGNGGNPGFGGEDLDNTMRMAFYPAIIGMFLVGYWISQLKYRLDKLQNHLLD